MLDKERLRSWIYDYNRQLKKSSENDSVKVATATFREAGSRLMMSLDHSDFDTGNLRIERQKAILDLKEMINDIREL